MPVRYLQSGQSDEFAVVAAALTTDDDDGGGWVGLQRTFVGIALSVSLAASTFAAQVAQRIQQDPEEIPAASLIQLTSPEEDYWGLGAGAWGLGKPPSVGVSPQSLAPSPQTLYLPDPEEIPAGSLFGAAEEDYWQNPAEQSRTRGVEQPNFSACRLLNFWTLDDEPAGSLYGVPEETEWQNPQISRIAQILQLSPYTWAETADVLPQVAFVPDEDYWQNPAPPSPPAVVGACRGMPLPYLPDLGDDPAGSLLKFTSPDEDFWDNPVNPVPPTIFQELPYLEESDDVPAGSLYGQPDEDSCQNPVAPSPPTLYQKLPYLPDPTDDPAGALYGQPDDDLWQNPVRPTPPANAWPQPWVGDTQEPAGSLFGQPDEDFWQNPAAPVPANVFQRLPYASAEQADIGIPPTVGFDEDFWQNGLAPIPSSVYQRLPYLPDPTDEPAGSLYGVPEETEWRSGVAPVPPCVGGGLGLPWGPQGVPLQDLGDEPAGSLYGVPEETEWRSGVAPAAPANYQALPYAQGEGAEVVPSAFTPEEDYWQTWAPQTQPMGPAYLPDVSADEVPPLLRFATPDEDYWGLGAGAWGLGKTPSVGVNPQSLAPSPQTLYLPDLSDDPAGTLYGVPEGTEWQNPVAPSPSRLFQPLPYASGESAEIAPAVAFQPDEDFWQNPVPPVTPWLFQRLPYLPDLSEEPAGSLYGVPEETEWQNPVEQSRSRGVEGLRFSTGRLLDFATSGAAENAPAILSDDDCWPPLAIAAGGWRSSNIPAQAARAWMQGVCSFDELTCFWWTPKWVARTRSDARGRMSHSIARGRLSRSTPRARVSRGVSRQTIL
jgi:hypothetical protein